MRDSRRGPAPSLLASPLCWAYGRAMAMRNRAFDAGRRVVTFDRPVISVGNLSVGGTGKTPMVIAIVRAMREAGRDPCIAMRGYHAARTGGESDEAAVYTAELPETPVVAQANRVEGLIGLFATERGQRVDCIVLDDGFQHRRIARQMDIVLIDAMRDVFADRLLPAGWLREPVSSLSRAQAVVVTHAESASDGEVKRMASAVHEAAPGALVAVARHEWTGLRSGDAAIGADRQGVWGGGDPESRLGEAGYAERPVSWLNGKRVVAVCAIGNPEAFVSAIERAGARIAASVIRPDHDAFAPSVVSRIIDAARREAVGAIVCTEKDWAKLRRVEAKRWPCDVVRPRLEMKFQQGWNELRESMLERVVKRVE